MVLVMLISLGYMVVGGTVAGIVLACTEDEEMSIVLGALWPLSLVAAIPLGVGLGANRLARKAIKQQQTAELPEAKVVNR